jgi:hypothetical protein
MGEVLGFIWCAIAGLFRSRVALQAENLVLRPGTLLDDSLRALLSLIVRHCCSAYSATFRLILRYPISVTAGAERGRVCKQVHAAMR